ncbi:amidohydrolase family protein [Lentibacter sp.]|uniref:amidohydrolase family protein n=1 Tax=Lentibacter sp. TaxID=2024994 RepID=UPI003F69C716
MIDAHHHLWDLNAVHYPWLMAKGVTRFFGDPAPIQRDYLLPEFREDAAGFHGADFHGSVHIQVGAESGLAEAKWVQSVADTAPDWAMAQVVFCDLTSSDLDAQLTEFASLSTVRGLRQIVGRAPEEDAVSGTNTLLQSDAFKDGLREAAARGLSFDLQLTPPLMEATAKVLSDVPALKVALCHAGSPFDRTPEGIALWATQIRDLAALPHVSCKLSGLGMFDHSWTAARIAPIVQTCLDLFGPERAMFGSNFPVDSLSSSYATLLGAYQELIPEAMQPAVFGETARAFYRL